MLAQGMGQIDNELLYVLIGWEGEKTDMKNLRKEGFILFHSFRVQFLKVGKLE